jgi:hypothetical protein
MHNNCENIYTYHLKTGGVTTVLKQQVEAPYTSVPAVKIIFGHCS